ncbi:lysozyme inhibitor LprI family protein [Cronobacter turicensis]|uniref:lysozyme inhibitor LprI family protein n=1 Tax=Cronobacter turicensis TaxID=413502 RepID=UPI000CFAFAE1|nr:lysozyme inhibitor LprI family protein [Cronobacter turicensis]ELY4606565.1 DUF1311 domain-containing protein [Cronobacter turicensis]
MKSAFLVSILLIISMPACAVALTSITINKSVSQCIARYGEKNVECLESLNDESEKELNTAVKEKVKDIATYDYERWWMGNAAQRENMLETFKKSQQEWVNYRDDYCATAVTAGQSSPYFGAYWTSCILNMNKRRIEEIVMTKTMISD